MKNFQKILRFDYLILAIIIVLIYFKTLDYGFVNLDDDIKILNNYEKLSDPSNLIKAFSTDSYFMEGGYYYRPTLTLSFFVNAAIGGNEPFIYHFTNLLLHLSNCLLILFLLKRIGYDKTISLLIVCIYSVNPLLINAVVWIPGRNDLMASLFMIISLIYFIRYSDSGKVLNLIIHLLFFLLSVFSKETALLLPGVIFLYVVLIKKENYFILKNQIYTLSWLIIILFYLFMRSMAVESLESDTNIISNLLYNLPLLPDLAGKFILPINLSGLPAYNILTTIIGAVALVVVGILISLNRKKEYFNYLIFGFLWLIIFSMPGMFTNPGAGRFDYLECRAYIPMIGIVFLLVPLVSHIEIPKLLFENKGIKNILNIFIVSLIIIYSILNMNSSATYANPLDFYTNAIDKNPASSLAYNNRGLLFKANKHIPESIEDFKKAININPEFADAYFNLGSLYDLLGNKREALELFNEGLKYRPEAYNVYFMRGNIKKSKGDIRGAIGDYSEVLKYDSLHYRAYFARGTAWHVMKEYNKAIKEYTSAISIEPDFIKSYINRGIAFTTIKKFNKGIDDYNTALVLDSTNAEIYLYRANCKFLMSDTVSACLDWYKAASLGNSKASGYITRFCR